MSKYEDWADWAGDNSRQAEAELREAEQRRADRLARAAVKAIADQHNVDDIGTKTTGTTVCTCGRQWPCETVRLLSEAEEAISEAEDEAA